MEGAAFDDKAEGRWRGESPASDSWIGMENEGRTSYEQWITNG